jgi:PEP-CTERM putative exosortase interaction domain
MRRTPRLAACGVMALTASVAHADLQITNGNFQNNAPAANTWDVDSWFNSLPTASGQENNWWWEGTWYGPTFSPNGTSVMGLGYMFTTTHWAYQNIGVNDGGLTSLTLQFDIGSFTDAGGPRDLGVTLAIYQAPGSFIGADDIDIVGADGVTLIDSVSLTTGPLAPGGIVTKQATLNLGTANGTDPLFLRFVNFSTGTGEPWTAIDNIQIVPEPSAFALVALAGFGFLIRRRV